MSAKQEKGIKAENQDKKRFWPNRSTTFWLTEGKGAGDRWWFITNEKTIICMDVECDKEARE